MRCVYSLAVLCRAGTRVLHFPIYSLSLLLTVKASRERGSNHFYCMCKLHNQVSVLINTSIGIQEKILAASHGMSFHQRTWPSSSARIIQCPCSMAPCFQNTFQPNMERMCVDRPHGHFSENGIGILIFIEVFLQTVNKRFLAEKRLQHLSYELGQRLGDFT